MARAHENWYSIVWFGSGPYRMPPRGPFKSRYDARMMLRAWGSGNSLAGTIIAAHNVRILGPYRTRERARNADISDNFVSVVG